MAKLDTVMFKGRSGRSYALPVYVWRNRFKPVGAVYVVAERVVEPNRPPVYKPLYVGSTADVSAPFDDHPKSECFQVYLANVLAVLPVAEEEERRFIERDLIAALNPPCNGEATY